jgi:hypothetical protein
VKQSKPHGGRQKTEFTRSGRRGLTAGGPFCSFNDDDRGKELLAEVVQNLKQAINPPKETPGGEEDHHNQA